MLLRVTHSPTLVFSMCVCVCVCVCVFMTSIVCDESCAHFAHSRQVLVSSAKEGAQEEGDGGTPGSQPDESAKVCKHGVCVCVCVCL